MFQWLRGGDKVSDLLVVEVDNERRNRKKRIDTGWRRYNGDHPKPLKPSDTDPKADDNTSINLARRAVDIGAFYLFGKGLEFEVGDDGADDEADAWLDECWKANLKASFLLEFAISGGVAGDGFIRVHLPKPGQPYPRLTSLDASTVDVEWDPTDYREARRILIQFNTVDWEAKRAEVHRHRIERNAQGRWEIIEEVSQGDKTGWLVISTEVWPYDFCPVFHCKNRPMPHAYYGASDIEDDVLGLNEAVNFVLSNINRILRVHGHPQVYIAGQSLKDKLNRAIDAVLLLPNPEAKVGTVPSVTELGPHFDQLKKLLEAFHELTSVPEIASGKVENIGQLSGLALKILYAPLVQLVEVKRIFYGEMLVALCRALLVIGGFEAEAPVEIQWPEILPDDPKADAEAALAKQEAGVSKDTTIAELGYDAAKEAEKRAAEAQAGADTLARAFNAGNAQQLLSGGDGKEVLERETN